MVPEDSGRELKIAFPEDPIGLSRSRCLRTSVFFTIDQLTGVVQNLVVQNVVGMVYIGGLNPSTVMSKQGSLAHFLNSDTDSFNIPFP